MLQTAGADAVHQPGSEGLKKSKALADTVAENSEGQGESSEQGKVIGHMEFPTSGTVRTHFPGDKVFGLNLKKHLNMKKVI